MNVAQIMADFRERADDTLEPYLWSDPEILTYLDRAQTDFVRKIGGIADTHKIYVHGQQELVRLPDNLLKIRMIRDITNNREVGMTNLENADYGVGQYAPSYEGASPELIAGEKEGCLVFTTPPSAGFEMKIYYYRLPCTPIRATRDELEVKPQYVDALIHYMLYQAYNKQDSDAHDPTLAAKHLTMYTNETNRATEEKGRLEHVPRTVRYGGI